MFGFEWKGKPLVPTRRVMDEMHDSNIDIYKAAEVLEEGFDCSRSRRKRNVYERCMRRGGKIIKVVAADVGSYYKLIHAGEFGDKKGRFKKEKK